MSEEKLSPARIQQELMQFYGSEQWHRTHPHVLITDGVKYMADHCGAYWLVDCVASYQTIKKVAKELFQVIDLAVDSENHTAVVTVGDGNENEVFRQDIPYTDFPLPKIRLYYTDGVLLLPSEY